MFDQLQDWQRARCGKFTASEIHKLMQKGRGAGKYFSDTAMKYIREKAGEILTQEPNNGGRTNLASMEWGNSHEAEAIMEFEKKNPGKTIIHYGGSNPKFFEWSNWTGGSPDATMIEGDKTTVLEVKCPFNSGEHCEHLLFNTAEDLLDYKPEYYYQIVANCIFLNASKGILISYDPRFCAEKLQLKVLEIDVTDEMKDAMIERIKEAEKQLALMVDLVIESQ